MSAPRRIKVAYVVPDLGLGGAERHVATLMPRLDPARFEPMVVCLGREGELFASLADDGVPAVALNRTRRDALACLVDLVRHLRLTRPDIVLVRGFSAEVLGRVAAVVARVPRVVVWVHNCGGLRPRRALRRFSDVLLGHATDAYFGVAHAQRPYLVDELHYPARKISIIHNGVDPGSFDQARGGADGSAVRRELGAGDQNLVVGIVAALRPEKDHETFLRAARLIADRDPQVRFWIVGEGQRRAALEALVGELGLGEQVVFTGARSDVPALLAALDVFVLCSFTVECFPMALLEAMASARPAVCTAVGGIPELLTDGATGHLVPTRDPAALAERLTDLLANEPRRREFGEAARARVAADFTLSASVRQTEQAIAALW